MRVFSKPVASGVFLNANYNSPYVPLKQMYTYTMCTQITGTPNGSVFLQGSNDPETNDTQTNAGAGVSPAVGPTNWVTIKNSTIIVTDSGEQVWNVFYAGYNYVRVVYNDASGGASSATMNIIFNGKG